MIPANIALLASRLWPERIPIFNWSPSPTINRSFPWNLLIGDKEHRRREGLCHHIALKPFMGGRKIAVIDDADYLNAEGANALLKTLEEPPPRSVLILIGTSPAKQLPTIRSRCQLVRFQPLEAGDGRPTFIGSRDRGRSRPKPGVWPDTAKAAFERAAELADRGTLDFSRCLYQRLAAEKLDSVSLAQMMAKFVEEAGKEAAPGGGVCIRPSVLPPIFIANCSAQQTVRPTRKTPSPIAFINEALKRQSADAEKTAARLERCLDADQQIDRNANQSTLIETWLDDLAGI